MNGISFKNCWLITQALTIFLLVVFLWVQWPMRVVLLGNARLINDFGQIAFSFFWCMAFAVACVLQSHLQISSKKNSLANSNVRIVGFIFTLPWAFFLSYSAWPLLVNSWHDSERFPDSFSPGFYLIKLALILFPVGWLIAGLYSLTKAYRAEL